MGGGPKHISRTHFAYAVVQVRGLLLLLRRYRAVVRRACVAARPVSQDGPQGCTVAGRLLGEGVALLAGRWTLRAAHLVWLPAAAC